MAVPSHYHKKYSKQLRWTLRSFLIWLLLSSSDTSNPANMNFRIKNHKATVVLEYATKPHVITTLIYYFFWPNGLLPNWQKPVNTISLNVCSTECSPTLTIFLLYVSFSFGPTTNDGKLFFPFVYIQLIIIIYDSVFVNLPTR